MISVCYTSARPHLIAQNIRRWIELAYDQLAIEFIVTIDPKFEPTIHEFSRDLPGYVKVYINHGRPCCVDGWNLAARKATGDILIQMSDDLIPPAQWDLQIHRKLNNGDMTGVLGISDGLTANMAFLPHAIVTRKYYNQIGYFFHDSYWSMFSDNEFSDVANMKKVVINGLDVRFTHTHGQIHDEVRKQHEGANYGIGSRIYNFRKQNAFHKWKYDEYIGDDGDSDGIYSPNWHTRLAIYWNPTSKTPDHYLGLHRESLARRRQMFGTANSVDAFQVLIPTLPRRKPFLDLLLQELDRQGVSYLVDDREGVSVGEKRNHLIASSSAPYVTFVDDDDWISHRYAETIADALTRNRMSLDVLLYDVLTMVNNETPRGSILTFEHGNQNLPDCYLRVPNHLMVWKRETALKEKFAAINRGEDADWANRMVKHAAQWARVDGLLYFYEYMLSNTTTQK